MKSVFQEHIPYFIYIERFSVKEAQAVLFLTIFKEEDNDMHEKEQEKLTLTVEELQLLLEAMEDEEFLMSIPLALEGDEDDG